jgi:hypothetical protein
MGNERSLCRGRKSLRVHRYSVSCLFKSLFLDYIAASGGGLIETLDGYRHYEVVTLNQIIDVAATREPEIEIVPKMDAT